MRFLVCVTLAIGLVGIPKQGLAQESKSSAPVPTVGQSSKQPETCGRYVITLKSGETLKKVKACWILGQPQIKVVQNGTVRMIPRAEIEQMEYREGFWEKVRDGVRLALLIPAFPVFLLMFYLNCPSDWN